MTERFKKLGDTIVIRRPKVKTDERGRTVWVGDVDSVELELLSTQRLEKILKSEDKQAKQEFKRIATAKDRGIVAKDTATGVFQVLDPDKLEQEILEQTGYRKRLKPGQKPEPKKAAPAKTPELSLVDTQALKKILVDRGVVSKDKIIDDEEGGYDPYNSAR